MTQEFNRIAHYFAPLAAGFAPAHGLKDDVASLSHTALFGPQKLNRDKGMDKGGAVSLISNDMLVEGVHFLPQSDPFLLAQKALAVNLSDLAAKGANQLCYFLALATPKGLAESWFENFAAGLAKAQQKWGLHLAGGDSVSLAGNAAAITISITIIGICDENAWLPRRQDKGPNLAQNQAQNQGADIWVSGPIGDGFLGLEIAKKRAGGGGLLTGNPALNGLYDLPVSEQDRLEAAYLTPAPQIPLGQKLACLQADYVKQTGHKGLFAMDISDGLMADLGHLCAYGDGSPKASGAQIWGAQLWAAQIPLSAGAEILLSHNPDLLPALVTGGDDYQILLLAPPALAPQIAALGMVKIGKTHTAKDIQLLDRDGKAVLLAQTGWVH